MFGLSEGHYNIVKSACRKCNEEGKQAIKDGATYDQVMSDVITRHHKSVEPLISRLRFTWLCGYLAGRFGRKDGEYE